ncbi:uncharacterized protein LOC109836551 [Asparagus officinalis]|uniref:uncharacterized protein LOC109836551 n=1 Tax=Asparagus officinalis TaxID=4686 RepID=UPI00098DF3FF|nr:uncharacterized protein LOC109836551 [Asparagus officinalis]
MNIVVHSAGRACFLSSHDASADKHDAKYIFDFVDKAIDQIGEANVIQIVTDGASNNMAASKLLIEKRPNIFWTTCATHTVNLMLCDIAKIKLIRNAILMGRSVSVFIYNHTKPLQLFREFTKGDLVRPGVTRFATAFLSLQSLRDHKKEMRQMFISDQWTDCSLSRTSVGKKVAEIIASNKFWDNIDFALKVFTPLVNVLRRADGDKIGSMGFIYGDMLVAMEELKVALRNDDKKYNPILSMIESRFKKNLCGTLHKAGYFLNPFYYYPAYTDIEGDGSFMNAIVKCMHRLFPDDHVTFTKIGDQIPNYQERLGSFGDQFARRSATKGDCPVTWWRLYGNDTPELRKMAMKILGLTTSSSACERNWSTFEMIHTKKRNRLTHKKLHDLVFVKFNAKLKNKHAVPNRDPLTAYDDEERVTEWLLGEEEENSDDEVFPGECLTFRQVGDISGANPRKRKSGRLQTYRRKKKSGSSSSKGKEPMEDDEEEEMDALFTESDEDDNTTFDFDHDED